VCALGASLPQPIRELVAPSARWIEQVNLAQGFVNGTVDAPFGHQWANRTPIIFPLTNLVFWGLGLPLGIAACIGFLYALWRLIKGRRWWAYLIPLAWAGLYFLYQSTQWTKSMRYLLPVYPMLCLCAAIGLVALWRQSGRWVERSRNSVQGDTSWLKRLRPHLATALTMLVCAGTLIWAWAFIQIYGEPISRVTASRWAYTNIPTAITLRWTQAESPSQTSQLQVAAKQVDLRPRVSQSFQFKVEKPNDGRMANLELVLNHLQGAGVVAVTLTSDDESQTFRTAQQYIDPQHPAIQMGSMNLQPDSPYLIRLEAQDGALIRARTSSVANEHWDDAVPQPIDGKDAYGGYYNGLTSSSDGQIQNYAEDDPDKLPKVLSWLDEADYLVMSSNRLYASIPRLPWRFPMTSEYYRAMLNGELGFELVADFNSFARLGPFVFNDQEMPQVLRRTANTAGTPPGVWVPYPTAEEAFSVYDHPRVLIFKKTVAYSHSLAQQVLGKYDLTRTIKQTPLIAVNTPHGMLFDDVTRLAQQAGGTWSELFPRESPLNQSPFLAILAWLILIELLGLIAFPIIALATLKRVSSRGGQSAADESPAVSLIDGGYSFAKTLALLLVGLGAWWLGSTKLAAYSALQIWALIAVLAIIGIVLWQRNRAQLAAIIRTRISVIAFSEAIFLIGFALFLIVRMGNPDLWHPYMGGEKPMDFAYLNAVLKSSYFPPIDPWFAGGYINYYYFGFVLVGTPVKALGIDPSIAYNLIIPLLFGLTAMGAFGLGATLYARIGARPSDASRNNTFMRGSTATANMGRAIFAGCLAALFVLALGNLRELDVLLPAWQQLGGVKAGVPPLNALFSGFAKWITGTQLPIYPNWPYWNPTRPTAGAAIDAVPIAEFPLFTFLYADLHAHMMAMPFAYLALAFVLSFAAGARRWVAIILGAAVVGSLWPTNTWDYPVYLVIAAAALVIAALHDEGPATFAGAARRILGILPTIVVFGILTRAFYIPYLENYGAAYNSVEPWMNERTPIGVYLTIYGLFLAPLLFYLGWGIWRNYRFSRRRFWAGVAFGLVACLIALFMGSRGAPIFIVALPIAALAFVAALMPGMPSQTRIFWLLTSGAFTLTLFVELFTLRGDIGRMNTVFKFYIQAWLLLGITAAVAVVWVFDRISKAQRWPTLEARLARHVIKPVFTIAMAALIFLAALYPLFATPAKVNDRYVNDAPRGLDGMAYMTLAIRDEGNDNKTRNFPLMDDYLAIKWMQDHVHGSPTIIEGTTGPNLYRWGNRFSIYTGLPTVVGWQWHQRQQRAALDDRIVYDRDADLTAFYGTTNISEALMFIRRYNAGYVIVGQLERAYYDEAGMPKFDSMVSNGFLRVAYQNHGTTIYEVNPGALIQPPAAFSGEGELSSTGGN
jgi:YYY domain-containing protein